MPCFYITIYYVMTRALQLRAAYCTGGHKRKRCFIFIRFPSEGLNIRAIIFSQVMKHAELSILIFSLIEMLQTRHRVNW